MMRKAVISVLMLLHAAVAGAQFYTQGADPGSLKWRSMETSSYRVIYPVGADSLATVYATALERARRPVGGSIGVMPNETGRRKLDVVLHTMTADNNGIVTWTPSRLELLTTPDAYSPIALTAAKELAIHESRHVAQMQLGGMKPYRVFNILTGELVQGALSAVYGGPVFLEGDAVATETALTASGRGRSASFLEYVRACASEGQSRSYWQWLYGSQRLYTPDHYRVGYMMQAGLRSYCGIPDFPSRFHSGIVSRHGWRFGAMSGTISENGGAGTLKAAFGTVSDSLYAHWSAEEAARAPYTESRALTPPRPFYTTYTGSVAIGGSVYSRRSSLDGNTELVRTGTDGIPHGIGPFESASSRLCYHPATSRIYWSEYRRDPRWELRSESIIRYMESPGRYRDLTHGGRLYNPAPCGSMLSVTEYPCTGGSAVVLLDPLKGARIRTISAPGDLQIVETATAGGRLYASAISEEGFGIYDVDAGFTPVLAPRHVQISQLSGQEDGTLDFISDLTGASELYSLAGGTLLRRTSSRVGTSDYAFCGDSLYFSAPQADGRLIRKAAVSALSAEPADWYAPHRYPMADELSASESIGWADDSVEVSAPVPYSKFGHLMRLHSWLPVYFDYDAASDISFETLTTAVSAGATAFFQNTLGTASGTAGVKLLDSGFRFRPSAHLSFTYTGLYPVIEAKVHCNQRDARAMQLISFEKDGRKGIRGGSDVLSTPSVTGSLSTYVPLYFNSGGWRRGVIPQFTWAFSNDRFFTTTVAEPEQPEATEDGTAPEPVKPEIGVGPSRTMQRLTASLRAYVMLPRAQSAIYPKLGAGANVGWTSRPGLSGFYGDKIYEQFYCYLPGFSSTQGLKLVLLAQQELGDAILVDTFSSTVPRGMAGSAAYNLAGMYDYQTLFSVDYGIPFASVDWDGLCPVAYVRNLELIPHFDCTWLGGSAKRAPLTMLSAGASLSAVLGNLAWIPYDTRIGVTWSVNGGTGFKALGDDCNRNYFGFLFSIDM